MTPADMSHRSKPLTRPLPIRYAVEEVGCGSEIAIRSTEAPRVHHAARWRGGGMAARGARAAAEEGADHRIFRFVLAVCQSTWTAAFVQRMREHGWIEDRTVVIEYRWAEGRGERFAEIATEFVRLKVDIIVTAGTDAVIAAKKATSVIPIVFGTAGDPVANGLIASLARPGGEGVVSAATILRPCSNLFFWSPLAARPMSGWSAGKATKN